MLRANELNLEIMGTVPLVCALDCDCEITFYTPDALVFILRVIHIIVYIYF